MQTNFYISKKPWLLIILYRLNFSFSDIYHWLILVSKLFKEIISKTSYIDYAFQLRGDAKSSLGYFKEAKADYYKAIELDPRRIFYFFEKFFEKE